MQLYRLVPTALLIALTLLAPGDSRAAAPEILAFVGEDTLTFEESCPGEDPIYEFAIDISPAIAAGTQ